MKKSISKVIWFLILLTLALWFLQTNILDTAKVEKESWIKPIDEITQTSEINLSNWLAFYQSWTFQKITLDNWKNLKGFVFVKTGSQSGFLGEDKPTNQYIEITTKKPLETTIEELWISLTWATTFTTTYTEKGMFMVFIEQFGGIILMILIFSFIFKFMMWKGNGAWWLLNIKVWQKTDKDKKKTKFTDIAGMEEVKNELIEVVDYLKNPEKYKKVWARHPKGVLLYGEPGSWKTLLARAVAGEADVHFVNVSGSEFMEMLVGMWAAKVRTLFKQAKDAEKAIIFIDEIDAIGRKRWAGHNWSNQEQEQTLNQILTEMDGFDNDTNVIVIAATNRPDILDPALLRAGRFDRKIYVSAPTAEERTEIFQYYLKDKKVSDKVQLESLTKRTSGLVWADIENIVNEASLRLAKDEREILEVEDFEYALEKVIMWPEKKTKWIQEKEKKLTAFHELGHALLAHIQEDADPVEKISIVRRWHALWVTRTTPTEDKNLYSKQYLLSSLSVMLAWRAAEEIFFGKEQITTGASNDFERANKTIRNMLTKFGMDEELGMVVYEENPDFTFIQPYSEATALKIDAKIKQYLDEAYQISRDIITKYKKQIEDIALILIDKEFITGEEFAEMIDTAK